MRRTIHLPLGCLALFLVAMLCAGCASRLPPLHVSGQSFVLASDEALLWEQAAREHRQLSTSLNVLRDPILDDYLMDVVHRLLPPGTREAGVSPSVHVLINPSLNAFAYPPGAIYVHSGLLARLETEAQLAAVLAHEISHIVHRHAIRHLREERNKDLWKRIAVVTTPLVLGPLLAPVGISVSGANPAVLLQRPSVEDLLADEALDSSLKLAARRPPSGRVDQTTTLFTRVRPSLALLASVRGYQPSLVEEAERFTVEAMARGGYDPREADRTLTRLRDTATAQAAQEPYWWGRAGVYETRRQALRTALTALPADAMRPAQETARVDPYRERTRILVRENAMAELKAGRTDEAIAQLHRARLLQANDPLVHYYLGQVYAAKAANADELRQAATAYATATQVDAAFADAYRELAIIHTKLGDSNAAAAARQAYVGLRGEMPLSPLPTLSGVATGDLPPVTPQGQTPRP